MNRFKTTNTSDLFKILENQVILVLDPIELRAKQEMIFQTYIGNKGNNGDMRITLNPLFRLGNEIKTDITIVNFTGNGNTVGVMSTEMIPCACNATIVIGIDTKKIYVLDEDRIREFADLYAAERMHDLHEMYQNIGDYYKISKYNNMV